MKTAQDLVAEAKSQISEIALEQAPEAIKLADVLVDVREPEEFNAGHIQGAMNIPRGLLEFKLTADSALQDRSLKVVVYCKNSGRSALSALAMKAMGYLHVESIAGGIEGWIDAGKDIAKPELPEFD